MQERVYNKGKIANVEELRQRIVDEWVRHGCTFRLQFSLQRLHFSDFSRRMYMVGQKY